MSGGPGDELQYFRRLKLEDIAVIPRPACLPEDKTKAKQKAEDTHDHDAAEAVAHGRDPKAGKSKKKKDDTFVVVIPLGNDRMKGADLRKTLKSEYAARYLEKLGASPTPANLQLIWKYMPLEKCTIQEIFHPGLSKAEKKNFISIRPMYEAARTVDDHLADVNDITAFPLERLPRTESVEVTRVKPGPNATADPRSKLERVCPTFTECREKYLYPYNLPLKYTMHEHAVEARRLSKTGQQQKRPKSAMNRSLTQSRSQSPAALQASAMRRRKKELSMLRETAHVLSSDCLAVGDDGQPTGSPLSAPLRRSDTFNHSRISAGFGSMKLKGAGSGSGSGEFLELWSPGPSASIGTMPSELQASSRANLTVNTTAEAADDADGASTAPPGSFQRGSPTTGSPRRMSSNSMRSLPPPTPSAAMREAELVQMQKEMDQAPVLGTREIRDFQTVLLETIPFDKFFDPKLQQGLEDLKAELRSERFATFVKTVADMLHCLFLMPPAPQDEESEGATIRNEQFLAVYEEMLALLDRKKHRRGHALDLPVTVMCVRASTEHVMRRSYPLWAETASGVAVLQKMDALLTVLLDPMDYLSHLAPIEASPQALKILHERKLPGRMPFSFTSPVMRFIIGDPVSHETKTLFADKRARQRLNGTQQEALAVLPPDLRCKVLRVLMTRKMGLSEKGLRRTSPNLFNQTL